MSPVAGGGTPLSPRGKRLGYTFARKFHLVRPAVAKVLEVAAMRSEIDETERPTLAQLLSETTSLGTIYVESMPRYACGAGLLDSQTYLPTPLGHLVKSMDPGLEQITSLWLMHYHMASPVGNGPPSWEFIFRITSAGQWRTRGEIEDAVADYVTRVSGKSLSPNSIKANIVGPFINTYLNPDGLAKLRLFKERDDWLESDSPLRPGPYVTGYTLAQYWMNMWPDAAIIPLRDLTTVGGLAGLFHLSQFDLNSYLRDLQSSGFLELWQIAPPHQVRRRFESPDDFLPYLYE